MSLDLSTNYGGLPLNSPLIVGACPRNLLAAFRQSAFEAGAGALVLPSIFEEQIIRWHLEQGHRMGDREQDLLRRSEKQWPTPAVPSAESYLQVVEAAANQLPIPIIANINGYSAGGWLRFAKELQEAGAAAIELNVHQGPLKSFRNSSEIETSIMRAVAELKKSVRIPVMLKIDQGLTSVPHLARRIGSGIDAIVLFGRHPEVDICLDSCALQSAWRLSEPTSVLGLIHPLLQTHSFCPTLSIGASGGISSGEDVAKVLLAGADVAMVTSAVYRNGADCIAMLLNSLTQYLESRRLTSLDQLRLDRPPAFSTDEERINYMAALSKRLCGEPEKPIAESLTGDRFGHLQNSNHLWEGPTKPFQPR